MPKSLNRSQPLRWLLITTALLLVVGACSSQPPAMVASRESATESTSADNQHTSADSSAIEGSDFSTCRRAFEQLDSLPCEAWEGSVRELVDDLHQRLKACLKIDDDALSGEGLSQDLMIHVENHRSLLLGLRMALRTAKLDFIMRDGCLLITSGARAADTQYRSTLLLTPLLNGETSWGTVLRQLQTAEPESVWQQVHGVGGELISQPTEKKVEVTQTAWVLWQLEKWLKSQVDKSH